MTDDGHTGSYPAPDVERTVRQAIEAVLDGRLRADEIPGNAVLFVRDPGSDDVAVRLDMDSLDALELALALEAAYGHRIPRELDTSAVRTVDDLCRLVAFLLALAEAGGKHPAHPHEGTMT